MLQENLSSVQFVWRCRDSHSELAKLVGTRSRTSMQYGAFTKSLASERSRDRTFTALVPWCQTQTLTLIQNQTQRYVGWFGISVKK